MKVAVRVRPGARTDHVGGSWAGPRGRDKVVAIDGDADRLAARLAELLG